MYNPDHFVLLDFDTGAAATGWAMFCVDIRAFASSRAYIMQHLQWWDCGELRGTENEILEQAIELIVWCTLRFDPWRIHILTEDFDLTQTIGDKENLLSPVRQNAVLDWECRKRSIQLKYQGRNHRMSITRDRLALYGFEGRFRKDEFAAMQHGVVHLKRLKRESISSPWRLAA